MVRRPHVTVLIYLGVALFLVTTIAPMLWLVIMSISLPADLTDKPLSFIPRHVDLSHYGRLFTFSGNSLGEAFLMALRRSTAPMPGTASAS